MAKALIRKTTAPVILELTENEASTLARILCQVGGPSNTRRRHADAIRIALNVAGVEESSSDFSSGSIYFKQEEVMD